MWRKLVVNYAVDQNQHAANNITTTRCTYKSVQNDGMSRPTLKGARLFTIIAFGDNEGYDNRVSLSLPAEDV